MPSSRFMRTLRRFARHPGGVAATEFALILPLMLMLYLGGNEFGHALTLKRKVTHVTSTIADLVTQSKTVTNADMTNILDAASTIMAPYSDTSLSMTVSLVYIDEANVATVVWSDSRNGTALTVDSEIDVPDNVDQADTYVVVSEVHYPYTPTFGYVLTGSFDLWDEFFLRPRQSESVGRIS